MSEEIRVRNKKFVWGSKTYVMGIVNITPDSFSGDGLFHEDAPNETDPIKFAIEQVADFLTNGADIIDIGGESTRPGAKIVSEDEEIERVIPIIKSVRAEFPDAIISIDTYKARVAEQAIAAGADIINDVWGFFGDPKMANTAADANVPVILMHNRSKPENAQVAENLGGRYVGMAYNDLLSDITNELRASIDLALDAGVKPENIIIDPGIGFGKTVEQNCQLIDQLHHFKQLGKPILLGPSRKSFIGYTLDLPPHERVEGTAATIAIGIDRGADIIRVHDVKVMARVAKMTDAITRRGSNSED